MSRQEAMGQMKALDASIRKIQLLISVREHETKIKQPKKKCILTVANNESGNYF